MRFAGGVIAELAQSVKSSTVSILACALLSSACTDKEPAVFDLAVVGRDFAFDAPDSIPEGLVRVRLDERGPSPHHVVVLRVPSGHTAQEALQLVESDGAMPDWLESVGGPEGSELTEGRPSFTSYLERGAYLLACVLLDDRGEPHYRSGMVRELTIYPRSEPALAELPAPSDTIVLADFSFLMPDELQEGPQRFWVENRGTKRHHAEIVRVPDAVTYDRLMDALQTMDPDFPIQTVGGITGLSPGKGGILELELAAGTYALLCMFFDDEAGLPHTKLGMVRVFEVR